MWFHQPTNDQTPEEFRKKRISQLECVLVVLVAATVCLTIALFSYSQLISPDSNSRRFFRDIQLLEAHLEEWNFHRGTLKPQEEYTGDVRISVENEQLMFNGQISGFAAGATLELVVLDRGNIPDTPDIQIPHFDPYHKAQHKCARDQENYHAGDLGTIVTDDKKAAEIRISSSKLTLLDVVGKRLAVIRYKEFCDKEDSSVNTEEIVLSGVISVARDTNAFIPEKAESEIAAEPNKSTKFLNSSIEDGTTDSAASSEPQLVNPEPSRSDQSFQIQNSLASLLESQISPEDGQKSIQAKNTISEDLSRELEKELFETIVGVKSRGKNSKRRLHSGNREDKAHTRSGRPQNKFMINNHSTSDEKSGLMY